MRRKAQPKEESIVPPEVLHPEVLAANIFLPKDDVKTVGPCIVCGSETTSDLPERLCWVCRRLKISAWRESEQMPAQE
jgi:hypothetical protein